MSLFFKKKPKISIVVIIYNKEKYIEECLDSIISQEIDKEIICVDDCSTDNTLNILKKYKKNNNIKIIRNEENLGTCLTRYNGLKKCKGEYVLFVDGDDKLIPNSLSVLYDEIIENNKPDILEFTIKTSSKEIFKIKNYGKYNGNLLEHFKNKKIKNTLTNKLISNRVYEKTLKLMNPDLKQDNYFDVIYFLYHFLSNATSLYQSKTSGYFYYDDRGMTSNSTKIETLKHYCNFGITYDELCYVYGETKELFHWKNIVCNQAIEAFIVLSKEDQKKNKKELKKIMTDEEIDFLISEKKK